MKGELDWIQAWLTDAVFGVSFETILNSSRNRIELTLEGYSRTVTLPNTFLHNANSKWLAPTTLPSYPLSFIDIEDLPEAQSIIGHSTIPVLFPEKKEAIKTIEETEQGLVLNIDVFGSLFFLMSRYEEAVCPERDNHNRFPATASVMGKSGLLNRAIGNEYIEILWAVLKRTWPKIERKARSFRILPSHDIDIPSAYWNKGIKQKVRLALSTAHHTNLAAASRVFLEAICYPRAGWAHDPFDTINWIMDVSERNGLRSAFYYIPEQTDPVNDPGMPLTHPQVEEQWIRIISRGHEIGVHPGYNTFDKPKHIRIAVEKVRIQLDKLGIRQKQLGGRQHFLRWKTSATAQALDTIGVHYDSTLGFADHCGFRSGICYEYTMYDIENRRPLKLVQRPLIVMECTVLDSRYMKIDSHIDALNTIQQLKRECRKYNGDFSIL